MTSERSDDSEAAREKTAASGVDARDLSARPLIERVGLGAIALVLAVTFGGFAVAALSSGEVFLGVMAGIGALMTVWAAASTLRRG